MAYTIKYVAFHRPYLSSESLSPQDRSLTVPWLWIAQIIVAINKESWGEGGSVVDEKTGETRLSWSTSGNILGDGSVQVVRR